MGTIQSGKLIHSDYDLGPIRYLIFLLVVHMALILVLIPILQGMFALSIDQVPTFTTFSESAKYDTRASLSNKKWFDMQISPMKDHFSIPQRKMSPLFVGAQASLHNLSKCAPDP